MGAVVVVVFSLVVPTEASEGALLNREDAYPREPFVIVASYCFEDQNLRTIILATSARTEYGP